MNTIQLSGAELRVLQETVAEYKKTSNRQWKQVTFTPLVKAFTCALGGEKFEVGKPLGGHIEIAPKEEGSELIHGTPICLDPIVKLNGDQQIGKFALLLAGILKNGSLILKEEVKFNMDSVINKK